LSENSVKSKGLLHLFYFFTQIVADDSTISTVLQKPICTDAKKNLRKAYLVGVVKILFVFKYSKIATKGDQIKKAW
jgi:hypothetical protein